MRRNMIVVIAAGLAAVFLFWFVLVAPKMDDISAVNEQIEQEEQRERTLRSSLRQLQEAQRNAAATLADLAKFELLLPRNPALPTLIRQIQAAANADGIELRSIAPSPPSPLEAASGIDQITTTLQVAGGFFRMESFLARLEDLQRVVEVRSVALAPTTDPLTGQFTLQGTITMVMYVVQPGARAAGAPRPAASPASSPSPTGSPSPTPSPGAG